MAGREKGDSVARRGLMLVLSSPSGAGKTTLSRKLLDEDKNVMLSVSVTTRKMRPGEKDGRDYRFIDRRQFDALVEKNELLEWAEVFDNYYGTPKKPVMDALAAGRDVLFDIDWQGTQQLGDKAPNDLVSVFVLPPSIPELERRLHKRAQDDYETIHRRMAKAADEMSHWAEYDYVVINRDLDQAFADVSAILAAERLKRQRQPGLSDFVRSLQAKI
ncbi:MAG TPA: guanylate kinase [Pseudolabrys sp.]|jgi:guanylate kinase|nr:guanylate kinase [Pseudolabrys sp.]